MLQSAVWLNVKSRGSPVFSQLEIQSGTDLSDSENNDGLYQRRQDAVCGRLAVVSARTVTEVSDTVTEIFVKTLFNLQLLWSAVVSLLATLAPEGCVYTPKSVFFFSFFSPVAPCF